MSRRPVLYTTPRRGRICKEHPILCGLSPRTWTYSPSRARRTFAITYAPLGTRSSASQGHRHPGRTPHHRRLKARVQGCHTGKAGRMFFEVIADVHSHIAGARSSIAPGPRMFTIVLAHVHQLAAFTAEEDLLVQDIMRRRDRMVGSMQHGLLAAGLHRCAEIVVGDADLENPLLGHDQVGRCAVVVVYFDVVHLRTRVGCREGGLGAEHQTGAQHHGKVQDLLHVYGKDWFCRIV